MFVPVSRLDCDPLGALEHLHRNIVPYIAKHPLKWIMLSRPSEVPHNLRCHSFHKHNHPDSNQKIRTDNYNIVSLAAGH